MANLEGQIPSLGDLVDNAQERFSSHEYVTNPYGGIEGYGSFHASDDAVMESGVSVGELLVALTKQTTHKPEEFELELLAGDTWEELFRELAGAIIEAELADRNPQIRIESGNRVETAFNLNQTFTQNP